MKAGCHQLFTGSSLDVPGKWPLAIPGVRTSKSLKEQGLLPYWHCPRSWPLQTAGEEEVSCHIPHVTEEDWRRGWRVQAHRARAGTFEGLDIAAGAREVLKDLLKATWQVSVPGLGTFSSKPCVQHTMVVGWWPFPVAGTAGPSPSASHRSAARAGCRPPPRDTSEATEHHVAQLFIEVSPLAPDEGQGRRAGPGAWGQRGAEAGARAGNAGRSRPGDAVLSAPRSAVSAGPPARRAQHAPVSLLGRASEEEQLCWREAQHQPVSTWWALVWNPQLFSVLGKSNYGYFMVPRRGPRVSPKAHLSFWKEHLIT